MFVKVCGLTEAEHVDWAVELGYSAFGVVLYPASQRYVKPERALRLSEYAKGRIKSVAVGLTFDEVREAYGTFDYIQIYEEHEAKGLIYASSERPRFSNFEYFLYDASRGSGGFDQLPEWLAEYSERLIVAGGLNAENVAGVIRKFRCFGVDVSSGVEKIKGIKDYDMMKRFIMEARNAG